MAGRPLGVPNKSRRLSEEVKQHWFDLASKTLVGICESQDFMTVTTADRIKAASLLLAYAEGKPKENMVVTGEDGGPIAVKFELVGDE
jgi:hypothetical protein